MCKCLFARISGLLVLTTSLMCTAPTRVESLPGDEILSRADARIQQYRTGEVVLKLLTPSGEPLPAGRRVQIEQTKHKFLFGANIFMLGKCRTAGENAAYEKEFADLLNYATLPFYWWDYEPQEGQPGYAEREWVAQWCRQHQVATKGHPLAWNFVDPAWLPSDPDRAMQLQLQRIGSCVAQFKDQINIWDVVNEATHYDRPETKALAPKLTEAIRKVGVPAYLRSAFKAARQANPAAMLVINDYETGTGYAEKVISQLVDETGKPLYDVIGIQCHQHSGAWPAQKIWEICERFAIYGKPLHFTEATILSGQLGWDLKKSNPNFSWESTPEGEKRQAEEVSQFYTVLFSHPAVEAITWWDFSDQGAWQEAPAGLVRQDMTAKPAYEALMKLVKGKWWTRTEAEVAANGGARFRGFLGEYRVSVSEGGRKLTGTFAFDKTTTGAIEVRLN